MQYLSVKLGKCTFNITQEYTDSYEAGMTGQDDLAIGWCDFEIPAEHRAPMILMHGANLGIDTGDEDSEWPEGQSLPSWSGDVFINWAHYLMHTFKSYDLKMRSEHMFWIVHDLFHAKNDFSTGKFACSPWAELERFRQAYSLIRRRNIPIDKDYLNLIVDTFNTQTWGCEGTYRIGRNKIRRRDITSPKWITEDVL